MRCALGGGVIEHPAGSRAFAHYGLPKIGRGPDRFGGWSCEVSQVDFGHRAEKRTWLYICGTHPDDVPDLPPRGTPTALVMSMPECRKVELMGKQERERTPPAFAAWLVELARLTNVAPTKKPTQQGDQPRSERGREGMEPAVCESAAGRGHGAPTLTTLPQYASPGGGPMGAAQPAAAGRTGELAG